MSGACLTDLPACPGLVIVFGCGMERWAWAIPLISMPRDQREMTPMGCLIKRLPIRVRRSGAILILLTEDALISPADNPTHPPRRRAPLEQFHVSRV